MLSSLTIYHYIAIFSAAAVSFLLSPLCRRLAYIIGAIDVPLDSRRMHRAPIPRAGGIAVFFAFFITLALSDYDIPVGIFVGGTIMFAAGLCDDILRLSPIVKLLCQSVCATVTLAVSSSTLVPSDADPIYWIFAFFWIVLLSNAFNLIDGLDALCTRVAAVSAVCIFLISGDGASLVLAAAAIGFLPFNLHPAKMFLGDSGAMFLGYALSLGSLRLLALDRDVSSLLSLLLVFAFPLTDTALAFLRRLLTKGSPFAPDRLHLHHRLVDSGLTHPAASRLLVLFSAALGGIGVIAFISEANNVLFCCISLTALAALCILASFKKIRPDSLRSDR